jgi:chorismate mutase/prephenate dehydratase
VGVLLYIDIAGHPSEPHIAAALGELRQLCAFYKVLGAYPWETMFEQLG